MSNANDPIAAQSVDQFVGDRIRQRRLLLGYTQEQLAEALEISYQQVQKYETGANRVSAGRLFQIAQRLDVSVAHFFQGLENRSADADTSMPTNGSYRQVIELVRHFQSIEDADVRMSVLALVRTLSSAKAVLVDEDKDAPRVNGNGNGHDHRPQG